MTPDPGHGRVAVIGAGAIGGFFAAKLHEAGVRFCIRSGGTNNTRNLPYEAAMAVSYCSI